MKYLLYLEREKKYMDESTTFSKEVIFGISSPNIERLVLIQFRDILLVNF